MRIAVFASGTGSNFQAIVDAVEAGKLKVSIELLVCDKPQAAVVDKARLAGIPVYTFRPRDYDSREAYERDILNELRAKHIDLIVLAGYMRLITSVLVDPYAGKMINVHPSLLPSFPGIKAIEQAWTAGVKVTGVTVHYVDGGMDTGPIIAQQAIAIEASDTIDSLTMRVHKEEHQLLPQVIGMIAAGKVALEDNRAVIHHD